LGRENIKSFQDESEISSGSCGRTTGLRAKCGEHSLAQLRQAHIKERWEHFKVEPDVRLFKFIDLLLLPVGQFSSRIPQDSGFSPWPFLHKLGALQSNCAPKPPGRIAPAPRQFWLSQAHA